MTLKEELERARGYAESPPPNERSTCEWVIVPLLERAGYGRQEVVPEESLPGRKRPDYTILPGTPHTWYLEAKQWTRDLDGDPDLVVQVVTYAHAEGHRWVVLTNGRDWRLYDDHLTGVAAADRLVARARLECETEIEAFLTACSRESVLSGGLERYATEQRLSRVLEDQLGRPDSEVVRAICGALKRSGVEARPADVVAFVARKPEVPAGPLARTAAIRIHDVAVPVPIEPPESKNGDAQRERVDGKSVIAEPFGEHSLEQWYQTVRDRGDQAVAYKRPLVVAFPGEQRQAVSTWKELAVEVVTWVFKSGRAPRIPYTGSSRGGKCFVNAEPRHPGGNGTIRFAQVDIGARSIYVDTCRSAMHFVQTLHRLCRDVGVDPSSITITVR